MRNEEWKSRGKCSECRRQAYCKTQCKANKRYMKAHLFEALVNTYNERLSKKNEA